MSDSIFLRWHSAQPQEIAPGVRGLVKSGNFLEVGKIFLKAGTELKRHAHLEEQMFYLLEGRLRYRVGEVEEVAGPGDLIYFPGGIPHGGCVEGDADAVFIELKERKGV